MLLLCPNQIEGAAVNGALDPSFVRSTRLRKHLDAEERCDVEGGACNGLLSEDVFGLFPEWHVQSLVGHDLLERLEDRLAIRLGRCRLLVADLLVHSRVAEERPLRRGSRLSDEGSKVVVG